MATMATPKPLATLPRKRRPRASAGEVFVTSESVIYLMDPKLPANGVASHTATSQCDDYNVLRDIIYENVSLKAKPNNSKSVRVKSGYSCALRVTDTNTRACDSMEKGDDCESQHVSIYIGKNWNDEFVFLFSFAAMITQWRHGDRSILKDNRFIL